LELRIIRKMLLIFYKTYVKDDKSISIGKIKNQVSSRCRKNVLIKAMLNREVPPGKLPFDVGVASSKYRDCNSNI